MEIALAFVLFAALIGAWIAAERRALPPRAPKPSAECEPSRHGFLRGLARIDAA